MKKLFLDFLKEHKAHDAYVQNAWNDHHARFEAFENEKGYKREGISDRIPAEHWLAAAFDWANTPEGDQYWVTLNVLWLDILKRKGGTL